MWHNPRRRPPPPTVDGLTLADWSRLTEVVIARWSELQNIDRYADILRAIRGDARITKGHALRMRHVNLVMSAVNAAWVAAERAKGDR